MANHRINKTIEQSASEYVVLEVQYFDGRTSREQYESVPTYTFTAAADRLREFQADIKEIRFEIVQTYNDIKYPMPYIFPHERLHQFFLFVDWVAERIDSDPFYEALLPNLVEPDWAEKLFEKSMHLRSSKAC